MGSGRPESQLRWRAKSGGKQMKLRKLHQAAFDPETSCLTITGENSLGKSAKLEMPVGDAGVFITWIAAALYEHKFTANGAGGGIVADGLTMGAHESGNGQHQITFAFTAGDMKIAFILPVATNSMTRMQTSLKHFEQGLSELSALDEPARQ
jgi:hypothetical protein